MQDLIERLLGERGVTNTHAFLHPQYDDRPDPFLLPDMRVAVERIRAAISSAEVVAVWHDYDCDGIPGGSLLKDFFTQIEFPIITHAAERSEGYGLNAAGIDMLRLRGVSLLITVDCGITEHDMVAYAKERGIDVIVTDHHLPSDTLPRALAVINPHRADSVYPEKVLCGTGVAFKLVEALIRANVESHFFTWHDGQEKWLLDLVALATVADMVPLVGENRTLVTYGLKVLHKGRRVGLAALMRKERVDMRTLTEEDIAFTIAPKINASSRMESPKLGVQLLTTTDAREAETLALKLIALNKARKLEGARVAKEVKVRISKMQSVPNIIVLGNSEWRPALLGIAANTIIETYKRSVCLWGKEGDMIKGSCRSCGDINVVELFTMTRESITDFGGHEKSGGFSLTTLQTLSIQSVFEAAHQSLAKPVATEEVRNAAATLMLSDVTTKTYESLRTLAPFGVGNAKPFFRFAACTVLSVQHFGKEREHMRITLTDASGGRADAVQFFIARSPCSDQLSLLSAGDTVTIDASIEQSTFAGKTELRLRLEHITFSP